MKIQENLCDAVTVGGAALVFVLSTTLIDKVSVYFFKTVIPYSFSKGTYFAKNISQLAKNGISYFISKGTYFAKNGISYFISKGTYFAKRGAPYWIHNLIYAGTMMVSRTINSIVEERFGISFDDKVILCDIWIAFLITTVCAPLITRHLINNPITHIQSARHALVPTVLMTTFYKYEKDSKLKKEKKFREHVENMAIIRREYLENKAKAEEKAKAREADD